MQPARYRVTGTDTSAGGTKFNVTKMKIKIKVGGVVSGKMYYAASGSNPAQKQKINGTWSGKTVTWKQQYKFGSGKVYNYTYTGTYGANKFTGQYVRQDGAKGTFAYNLNEVDAYSSDSD